MLAQRLYILIAALVMAYPAVLLGDYMSVVYDIRKIEPELGTVIFGIFFGSSVAAILGVDHIVRIIGRITDGRHIRGINIIDIYHVSALLIIVFYLFGFLAEPVVMFGYAPWLWASKMIFLPMIGLFFWGYAVTCICNEKFSSRNL